MKLRIRNKLTYANVVGTLALFVALGGTSYAAITITGKNVKDSSLTGRDIKNGSIAEIDLSASAKKAGPQGLMGVPGVNGIPGVPGPGGEQGEQGLQGVPGLQGITGPTGANGSDAEFDGAAAGGDLSGTYPNPVLKAIPAARLSLGYKCNAADSYSPVIPSGEEVGLSWRHNDGDLGSFQAGGAAGVQDSLCGTLRRGIQVPRTGIYNVGFAFGWQNENAVGRREIAIQVEGVGYIADENAAAVMPVQFQSVSTLVKLDVGAVVSVAVVQDSGTNLIAYNDPRVGLWLNWEGPAS